MKKLISSILLAASASSSFLLAQSENKQGADTNQVTGCRLEDRLEAIGYRLEEEDQKLQTTDCRKIALPLGGLSVQIDQGAKTTTNYELPTANYDNSAGSLNCYLIDQGAKTTTNYELPTANYDNSAGSLNCYLMMDPAELKNIEEGIENLKGVFCSLEQKGRSSPTAVVTSVAAHPPVGSSLSSAVMLGKTSTDMVVTSTDDAMPEGNSTNIYFEDEICNNIYTSCLAKVASISLAERTSAEGISQEAKEWAAAERKAIRDIEKRKKELAKARKEKNIVCKEKESADAFFHGRDYVSKVNVDFRIKELAEELAEARVTTAEATLLAIQVKDTAQRLGAETDLTEAIEEEKKVLHACEEASNHALEQEQAVQKREILLVQQAKEKEDLYAASQAEVRALEQKLQVVQAEEENAKAAAQGFMAEIEKMQIQMKKQRDQVSAQNEMRSRELTELYAASQSEVRALERKIQQKNTEEAFTEKWAHQQAERDRALAETERNNARNNLSRVQNAERAVAEFNSKVKAAEDKYKKLKDYIIDKVRGNEYSSNPSEIIRSINDDVQNKF